MQINKQTNKQTNRNKTQEFLLPIIKVLINCFFLKEDDSIFSMREKQDHSAAVAFLKIVQQNPKKIRNVIPIDELFENVIGR